MKKVIGITGSIGSGKSYATKLFRKIVEKHKVEATFLDVDSIRRNILFKENIDRDILNKKIYSSQEEMRKYKEFINPKIREYLTKEINKTKGFIFIEWALLIEDSLDDIVDSIIMVYCEREVQIKRIENGDLGREEIIKRMNLQLTNEGKLERIRQLDKEFYIIDTSNNPGIDEYESILKKEGI